MQTGYLIRLKVIRAFLFFSLVRRYSSRQMYISAYWVTQLRCISARSEKCAVDNWAGEGDTDCTFTKSFIFMK